MCPLKYKESNRPLINKPSIVTNDTRLAIGCGNAGLTVDRGQTKVERGQRF